MTTTTYTYTIATNHETQHDITYKDLLDRLPPSVRFIIEHDDFCHLTLERYDENEPRGMSYLKIDKWPLSKGTDNA